MPARRIVTPTPADSEPNLPTQRGAAGNETCQTLPSVVHDLHELVEQRAAFGTVYADPPWSYSNTASRGAAVNHYSTMSLDAICREPVSQLVADNAHLHLWTTHAFLREAFDVIDAWGFEFKSCLVWIKPKSAWATTGD